MEIPKLDDLIRQARVECSGETLYYVSALDADELLEKCERLRDEAEALRQIVLLGCEAPPEQLSEHATEVLLTTRWIPVRDHNEVVSKLGYELDEARSLAREMWNRFWCRPWRFIRLMWAPWTLYWKRRYPWLEGDASDSIPPSSAEIGALAGVEEYLRLREKHE
jgi:hypothetical protein